MIFVDQSETYAYNKALQGSAMSILQILDLMASDTKRSHKIAVLEQQKTNALLYKVLFMALNPYVNFYIKKIPPYKPTGSQSLEWALSELYRLSIREFTGNAAIKHLSDILNSVSNDDAVVISRIIGKDLRCGVAEATVNTVVEGFIPTYPCLLASPYSQDTVKNIKFPAYSQLKADGVRANAVVENGLITIFGRSGRYFDVLGFLNQDLLELSKHVPYKNFVLDGELVVVDDSGKLLNRKTGNGIISKANKGTITAAEAKKIHFQIWDIIPREDFLNRTSSIPYSQRFTILESAITNLQASSKLSLIPSRIVNNIDEVNDHFNEMIASGLEGVIVKNLHSIWEDTRSRDLIKMKSEKTADLEIIGYNPGTGQYEGQVGSLITASSDRKVVVSISGFSQKLRREITENINNLIGTITEVMYNERITSKTSDVDSLFLPRFGELRTDKTVADHSSVIK